MSSINVWTVDGPKAVAYPLETLWEIVVNALIHRDYSMSDDVQILSQWMLTQHFLGFPSSVPRIAFLVRCRGLGLFSSIDFLFEWMRSDLGEAVDSRVDGNVTGKIPDEAAELACNGDAHLVGFHFPTEVELSIALGKAQLRLPGNIADELGLVLLADLLLAADVRGEAVGPGRLDQDAPHMLLRFGHGLAILIEGDLLGGVIEANICQLSLVSGRPGVAVVGATMPQHHGLQLLAGPQTHRDRVFSSTRQIADSLVTTVRQDNLHQVPGTRLARQQQRIAPIGLDRSAHCRARAICAGEISVRGASPDL